MTDTYNTMTRPDAEVIAELGKQAATADALVRSPDAPLHALDTRS